MTATQGTLQRVMMDSAVDTAVTMTAQMLDLPKETVTKILQVGLPMLAKMADQNPALLKALFAHSMKSMPEPVQQFYEKLAQNPEAQQRMVDEFKTMVGPMTESLSRDTARQAGTTEARADTALATTLPTWTNALGRETADRSEAGFGQQLRGLAA